MRRPSQNFKFDHSTPVLKRRQQRNQTRVGRAEIIGLVIKYVNFLAPYLRKLITLTETKLETAKITSSQNTDAKSASC